MMIKKELSELLEHIQGMIVGKEGLVGDMEFFLAVLRHPTDYSLLHLDYDKKPTDNSVEDLPKKGEVLSYLDTIDSLDQIKEQFPHINLTHPTALIEQVFDVSLNESTGVIDLYVGRYLLQKRV